MPTLSYSIVDSAAALETACDDLAKQPLLCTDTEFMRVRTYTPQLALLQFAGTNTVWCIDPVADIDLEPMWNLLFDATRQKVMHSGKQDYEAFFFARGDLPHKLFDTQVAAALSGHQPQIGYAGIVEDRFGVSISKSQTRSNWLQRPLTEAQLNYAAEDVEYLARLYEQLYEELEQSGRLAWALEDSEALTEITLYKPDPATAWQRIKSIRFLPPAEQARAKELAAWREERAVKLDKPRSWILSDGALREIAANNPQTTNQLSGVEDLPPATLRKQGEKLLSIVKHANEAFSRGEIEAVQDDRPDQAHKALLKELGAIVKRHADELSLPAEVLGSKRELNAIITGDQGQRPLNGWRGEILGSELLAAL